MMKIKSLPPLPLAWRDYLLIAGFTFAGWHLYRLYRKGDELAAEATKPLGQLLSDVGAWAGGWRPVELTDIRIMSHYLDADYRLTDEARAVLERVPEYQPTLKKWFTPDWVMKSEYRHKIIPSS